MGMVVPMSGDLPTTRGGDLPTRRSQLKPPDPTCLAMAAATMHEMGRLFEPYKTMNEEYPKVMNEPLSKIGVMNKPMAKAAELPFDNAMPLP
jgi:hypothetical protein